MLRREQTTLFQKPAPTDLSFTGVANETPGSLQWNFQEMTFGISLLMQLTTLIISIVALSQGGLPNTLMTILVLELVVQIVELTWYSTVGALYLFGRFDISIGVRYVDWAITTPTMMASLLMFVLWKADQACDDVLGTTSRQVALVCVIFFDLWMLFWGFVYETKIESMMRFYDRLACNVRPNSGLFLGFVPFLGVFTPIFVVLGSSFTVAGLVSTLVTFFTWALYGVVALFGQDLGSGAMWDESTRNSAYNILDIFSKNVVGLVVSSVALTGDYNTAIPSKCTYN